MLNLVELPSLRLSKIFSIFFIESDIPVDMLYDKMCIQLLCRNTYYWHLQNKNKKKNSDEIMFEYIQLSVDPTSTRYVIFLFQKYFEFQHMITQKQRYVLAQLSQLSNLL